MTRPNTYVYYDVMLEHEIEVKKTPTILKPLARDMWLELYLCNSGHGENTWAIAVISTKVGNCFFKTKYDSGRVNNDINAMAEECLANIRFNWDINIWRRNAEREIKERSSLLNRIINFFKNVLGQS